ncbi:hypothetical protein AAXE64_08365 [Priestia megaterium]
MMKKLMFAMAICGMLAACSSTTEDTSTNEEPKKEEVKEEKSTETAKTTEDTNKTSEEANTTEATEEDKAVPEETPAEESAKEEESNDPAISKEEFDKIQNGMTLDQVIEVIGGEGELQSETGAQGDQFYTSMYGWEGESGLGANAIIMFQGSTPKVESKSQFGLE